MRLTRIVALAVNRKGKSLEPCRRLAFVEQELVETKEDRAAVDPAREWDADRRRWVVRTKPATQFTVNRLDVISADEIQIRGQGATRRIEEPLMDRIRVRAAHQTQRGNMVRWNHPRVAGVELV